MKETEGNYKYTLPREPRATGKTNMYFAMFISSVFKVPVTATAIEIMIGNGDEGNESND
ncbi:hypothetical protein M3Y14_34595 (plasmid) [Bacillus thuringiensis]|uniref:hypothetical protein n=1 Tax=Bacillus thuringiensis TaxID=1428 RepID=UPI002225A22A|nr:hypothetical protein [Bacillus thuringiensis]UYX56112.1 hypothetical protein M3Y14_34595 [Bacillus thuringiensis]